MQQTIYPKRIIDCAGVEHPEHLLLHQDLRIDLIEHNLVVFSDKTVWGIGFSVQGIVEIYEGVSVLNCCVSFFTEKPRGVIIIVPI